jgi:hypothetical protein
LGFTWHKPQERNVMTNVTWFNFDTMIFEDRLIEDMTETFFSFVIVTRKLGDKRRNMQLTVPERWGVG